LVHVLECLEVDECPALIVPRERVRILARPVLEDPSLEIVRHTDIQRGAALVGDQIHPILMMARHRVKVLSAVGEWCDSGSSPE